MNKPLYKAIRDTGSHILSEIELIKNNKRIKTDGRRKRALVDTWNWSIDRAIDERNSNSAYERAVFRSYYGAISEITFKNLTIKECYKIMTKLATDMTLIGKGDWA